LLKRFELYIDNAGDIIKPPVVDGVRWKSYRVGAPSKLTFEVMKDDAAKFVEGNAVSLLGNRGVLSQECALFILTLFGTKN